MFTGPLPVAEISGANVAIVGAAGASRIEASVVLLVAVVSALPAPKAWVARVYSAGAAIAGIGSIAEQSIVAGRRVAGVHAAETQIAAIICARIVIVAVRRRSAGTTARRIASLGSIAGVTIIADERRMHTGTSTITDFVRARVTVTGTRRVHRRKTGIGFIVAEVGAVGATRAGVATVHRATSARAHVIASTVEPIVTGGCVV